MACLLLVRHADAGAGSQLLGRLPGCHLSPVGLAQSIHLATVLADLPVRAVYSSPLERALETAQVIADPHGFTPEFMDPLTEIDFGDWEGRYLEELETLPEWRQYNQCRTGSNPPRGESMHAVQQRMIECVGGIAARHPEGKVVIVSHADPVRAAVAYYLGIPLDFLHRFEISLSSITEVEVAPAGPRVTCINFAPASCAFTRAGGKEARPGTRQVSRVA